MTVHLTLSQARRAALLAQGLAKTRPTAPPSARSVGRILDRLQLLQIDSVNVLVRSHYLPVFSRLGAYDPAVLDRFAGRHPRRLTEYWAHEASFIDPALFPHLRPWQRRTWSGASGMDPVLRSSLEERILTLLASSRALTAGQVQERLGHSEQRSTDNWGWNWSAVKRVLEDLFARGEISSAGRTSSFERRYAPSARVLPTSDLAAEEADPREAILVLTERAAAALGIGTVRSFADYFRTPVRDTAEAVRILEGRGVLTPAQVGSWNRPAYLHRDAAIPRRAAGRALLSPFDSLVFDRPRLEELFGFHYRLEIYTPAAARRYGYYVLPFLLGETMAARVDLKADRATGRLLVRGSYAEPGAPADTADELSAELGTMAGWLGLQQVVVEPVGDLAAPLSAALGRR
ncbi:winged helix-turn-helix domain-containing protein [uncultured Arthrobacter sp.]|uniref:winged helix-turn-helix domain-containing protein n=1 Tax=uncultured Arthrobacter sp. TaxID=114050 RepID=UPI0025F28638|nr:crosslink repair DNA glycosylase YcaQ family protein [uncultured Arthrobacter sp.]